MSPSRLRRTLERIRKPANQPTAYDARRASPIIRPEYRLGQAPANKGQTLKAIALTRAEIDALFDAINPRRKVEVRQAAQMAIWYRCGARLGESLRMTVDDVDLDRGIVHIANAKGDKPGQPKHRTVGIDARAAAYMADWFDVRELLGIPPTAPLFCNVFQPTRGEPLWHTVVRDSLKTLADRAGVRRRVHPHVFRHTHAFELRLENWDMVDIKQQLGHTRLDTTEAYINHLAPARRLAAARRRAWVDPPALANMTDQEMALVLEYVRRQLADDREAA